MVAWAPRLPPAVSGSGVRCGRVCWARVSAVPSPSWLGCRGVFFALFLFFCWVSLSRALWSLSPHPLSFGLGCWLFFFSFFFFGGVCLLVSVSLFSVGRCSWLGVAGFGSVVPLCLFGGPVFGAFWGGVWPPLVVLAGGLVAVGCFRAPPLPPLLFCLFFFGGGLPVPPSAFPGLAHALAGQDQLKIYTIRDHTLEVLMHPDVLELHAVRVVHTPQGDERQLHLKARVRCGQEELVVKVLVDTGAQVSLVRRGLFKEESLQPSRRPVRLKVANGEIMGGGTHEATISMEFREH